MYLASQVGGWSTTVIGRFYNGRDHSTVCYAIQCVKALRQVSPEVDELLVKFEKVLRDAEALVVESLSIKRPASIGFRKLSEDVFLDELADRIADRLIRLLGRVDSSDSPLLNGEEPFGPTILRRCQKQTSRKFQTPSGISEDAGAASG
jgi:hypothetical protein